MTRLQRDQRKTKSITRLLENLKAAFENLGENKIESIQRRKPHS